MDNTAIAKSEHHPYYAAYIAKSGEKELLAAMKESAEQVLAAWKAIPSTCSDLKYRDGSWTIAQLIQHVNDGERIFAYRACALARGERQPLPGFEENEYAAAEISKNSSLADRIEEFRLLRASNILLFKGFTPEVLMNQGIVSNSNMSVRAIGRILIGHAVHHMEVVKERYDPFWQK